MLRSSMVLLLLTLSISASAEGFDYSYLQLNYSNLEFDNISVDGDGFGLSGSYAINPNWHAFGSYQDAGLDFGVDATAIGAGVGYNTEMSPVLDLFARLSFQYVDLDAPGPGSFDEDGLGFGVGLRFAASPELELNAGLDYVDFGDGNDTAFSAGALYNINDAVSVGLAGSWGDDTTTYTLGGRVYFGK